MASVSQANLCLDPASLRDSLLGTQLLYAGLTGSLVIPLHQMLLKPGMSKPAGFLIANCNSFFFSVKGLPGFSEVFLDFFGADFAG